MGHVGGWANQSQVFNAYSVGTGPFNCMSKPKHVVQWPAFSDTSIPDQSYPEPLRPTQDRFGLNYFLCAHYDFCQAGSKMMVQEGNSYLFNSHNKITIKKILLIHLTAPPSINMTNAGFRLNRFSFSVK